MNFKKIIKIFLNSIIKSSVFSDFFAIIIFNITGSYETLVK